MTSTPSIGQEPSRRDVLRMMAYGSAGAAAGIGVNACSTDGDNRSASSTKKSGAKGSKAPLLVVVELGGGNDGLSTLVPFADETYHRVRPSLALGAGDVVDLGNGYGLNARLKPLQDLGLAVLAGIGSPKPDLSHFEMLERWWTGVPQGLTAEQKAAIPPGFFGRLCDEIRGDELFTGVSLRIGSTPALRATKAATTALPAERSFLEVDPNGKALSSYLKHSSAGKAPGLLGSARTGTTRLLWIAELLENLPEATGGYAKDDFGALLSLTSQILRAGAGTRIVHVPLGESRFDTHSKHAEVHPPLMTTLGEQLAIFVKDLQDAGLADRVLIATVSEFGRRVAENDGGLDHGAASVAMMLGPVKPGVHGEPSPIDDLDALGNLKPTITFDRYFATMASWMGVDPGKVLPPGANNKAVAPIEGLLR